MSACLGKPLEDHELACHRATLETSIFDRKFGQVWGVGGGQEEDPRLG